MSNTFCEKLTEITPVRTTGSAPGTDGQGGPIVDREVSAGDGQDGRERDREVTFPCGFSAHHDLLGFQRVPGGHHDGTGSTILER